MRRFLGRIFQLVGFLTVVGGIGFAVLLFFAASWLTAEDTPEPADAVVLLSGSAKRAPHAATLLKQGMAPKIYLSRPQTSRQTKDLRTIGYDVPTQLEVNLRLLEQNGVKRSDVVLYGHEVVSTVEEAELIGRLLGPNPKRIILVTSPYHVNRARMIFEDRLPGWKVMAVSTPLETFPKDWWAHRGAALAVVGETVKTAFFLAGGAFRSTEAH